MAEPDELQRISQALDGEGAMPADLDAEGLAFLEASTRLRARFRIEAAATPPDLTEAVLAQVHAAPRRGHRPRSLVLAVAASFVVAALSAAAITRLASPEGPPPALADVGVQVIQAQDDVLALDAGLTLVERGAHPDVPERTYAGTLRYRAPERLWLHLADQTALPAGWPANDLDLVVDDGTAWSAGLLGCPLGEQPRCLRSGTRASTHLAPFAADVVAPLDLIVPVGAFLPTSDVESAEEQGRVLVDTTVARLQDAIDGLRSAGALRAVHPTDLVRIELDGRSLTLRRLTVRASGTDARQAWAASSGYQDEPGVAVLDLKLTPADLPESPFPTTPPVTPRDAGFRDTSVTDAVDPAWLPAGFSAHRAGTQAGSGPRTTIRSWSNGRAWIRVDATSEHTGNVLFGPVGPIVRRIEVGDGWGYSSPNGRVLSLHNEDIDLTITGSVPFDDLVRVAASLSVEGTTVPDAWPQGEVLTDVPRGALRPDGALIARYDGVDLLEVVPGPGQTSAILRQRPGTSLGVPFKTDVIEVPVRGVTGRYFPTTRLVTWIEDGWVRELSSDGLDLDELLAVAEALHQ